MVKSGDVLEHPVTREKIVVRKTAHDTGGELFQGDLYLQPGAFIAAEHIHPLQEERFEVISGTLRGRVAGKEVSGGPGEQLVVPAGTPHVWWNSGADEMHVLVEFRPALKIENFFETFFGLAQDGRVNGKTGLPNVLQMAVVMRAYRHELILARPGRQMQTLLFGLLAPIGRLSGYKADYPYPRSRQTQAQPRATLVPEEAPWEYLPFNESVGHLVVGGDRELAKGSESHAAQASPIALAPWSSAAVSRERGVKAMLSAWGRWQHKPFRQEMLMRVKAFLATTGHGLTSAARGTNGAWSVEVLLAEQDVRCLAADPLNPQVLYAGTQGNGVLRSNDGGKTWHEAGLAGLLVKALAVSPTQPGTVYAGTKPALLFVSRDGSASWTELSAFRRIPSRWFWFTPAEKPHSAYVQAIALSPTDPETLLVGVEFGAVVQSRDGGQSWTDHRRGALRDCHQLSFHVTQSDWAYCGGGTGAGVAVSRDGGATWTQPKEGLDRHYGWAVAADPAQPEVWYASLARGPRSAHSEHNAQAIIARSVGGALWQPLGGGLPQPLNHMPYALLTNPAAPGHVYAGLSNGDVWHTADYGDHWQLLPFNLGKIWTAMMMF